MNSVFFYSNYCKHCEKILSSIIKHPLRNDLHYICIDKRKIVDESIYIILENGTEMEMPASLKKVPSLLLINRGDKLLEGDHILEYLNKQLSGGTETVPDEPDCFSMSSGMGFGVQSDNYSYYDMDSDELSAKGTGGIRQMHNYCPPVNEDAIETPPDNYVPDTIGKNGVDMDKIIQDRKKDMDSVKTI